MSDAITAVVLGIIEGLTEFLPISSTGHMIVACPLLDVNLEEPFWKSFIYFIQIGAILAVAVHTWRHLWRMTFHPPTGEPANHIVVKLFVAFLPAAVVGLLLNEFLEEHLEKSIPVAVALIVGAALIELTERKFTQPRTVTAEQITLKQAFLVGCFQCLAMIPGTSRSGATIMGGLVVGLSAPVATEFSFFLAIPTIVAAGSYSLFKHRDALNTQHAAVLALGFAVSFVVAWAVVAWFLKYVRTHSFRVFVVYRVLLGVAVLTWYWWPRNG
jgi:undecaprenyl-diphosphatase